MPEELPIGYGVDVAAGVLDDDDEDDAAGNGPVCRVDRVDRRVGAEVGADPRRTAVLDASVVRRLRLGSGRDGTVMEAARLFMPSSCMMARLRATRASLSRS